MKNIVIAYNNYATLCISSYRPRPILITQLPLTGFSYRNHVLTCKHSKDRIYRNFKNIVLKKKDVRKTMNVNIDPFQHSSYIIEPLLATKLKKNWITIHDIGISSQG